MDFLALLWTATITLIFTFFVILNPVPFIITAAILIGVTLFAKLSRTRKNEHDKK